MKQTIKRQTLHTLLFSNYLNVFAFSLFGPLFTIFVLRLGATPLRISQLLAIYSLAFGLGVFFFGKVQNRIVNKQAVVVSGFFLLSLGAFSYLAVHSIFMAFVVQVFNALAAAWMSPAYKFLYAKAEDRGRETEQWSWVDGGDQILVAIATFLGGLILTGAGFSWLLISVGALQLAGACISISLLDSYTRS